jgi:AraC-like DNA-binding protein
MDDLQAIGGYVDLLQDQLGFDIILYDECRLLQNTALGELSVLGKWHTNPYCLKIKENRHLRRRCVALRPCFVEKLLKGEGVVKSTCYCGVTEYALPIQIDGHLVCIVAATGFAGEIRESTARILSRRAEMNLDAFLKLRSNALSREYNEALVIRVIEILGHLLSRFFMEHTDIAYRIAAMHQKYSGHVQNALDYIARHFTEPIDSDAVGKACHINTSYLRHLFSEVLGHGIAEEIRIRRLSYAEELLCTTDYSVKYISYLAGFSSSDYFSTAFKKHYGFSPLMHKRKYQRDRRNQKN